MSKVADLITLDEAAALTGYTRGRLSILRHEGRFVDSAKRVGRIHLYRPQDVRRWHREHIAKRSPRGVASPIPR